MIGCRMFFSLFLFTGFLFFIPAAAQDSSDHNTLTMRIDPSAASGGPVSRVIDEISFIPLESTPVSAFGAINQLEIADRFFIILDMQTNAVLIFDRSGSFHAKIEGKNIGYKGQNSMYLFRFDKLNGLIQIPSEEFFLCFDLDGKLVTKKRIYNYGDILLNINDKIMAYYSYRADSRNRDSVTNELILADGKNIQKRFFPYNLKYASLKSRDIIYSSHSNLYSYNDTSAWFLRPYDYTIYNLSPGKLNPAYRFIFPIQNSLPDKFTSDSSFNNKRRLFIQANKSVIYEVSNFFRVGDNIFFRLLNFDYEGNDTYIYNIRSQNLISAGKIFPDDSSFFLPVTDAQVGGIDFKDKGFLTTDGKCLYTFYSSLLLFRQKEATENKKPRYPQLLSRYFEHKQNEKGNPVLVQIKFKDEL
jgi:hypothetical protein